MIAAIPRILTLWLSLLIGATELSTISAEGGIPGTTQTDNGYDTEMGTDSICWQSQNAEGGLFISSPLIKNFSVSIEGVKLLKACPKGNNIFGAAPDEHVIHGERLRTGYNYTYRLSLDINMTSLGALAGLTSDRGPGILSVQVLNCLVGASGFCSPFIHEEATARIAEMIAASNASKVSDGPIVPPPTPRGYLHGDSHVHSAFVDVYLNPEDGPIYKDVAIDVPMLVNVPGDYFSIVAAQMYFYEEIVLGEEPILRRYDMSNALLGSQRLILYQAPAEILEVDEGAKYFVFTLIGASSLGILFLLVQTIKHRDHQVMKLSQASFLVIFLSAALVATISSFLMEPKNDTYCRISNPIILIALQILFAVMVGRLWRIHTLINPLLLKTMGHDTSPWSPFITSLKNNVCFRYRKNSQKLRREVTDGQLAAMVAVLTTPQVIIQVLGIILQPRSISISYNDDESIGRVVCASQNDLHIGETIIYYGYFLFCLMVGCLLVIAIQARKLPSLFNESNTIFDSALTSCCIMVMGMAINMVTQDPTTSPTVSYLVWVFIILSISVNTSFGIVFPKLRRVWRGEIVIVSQLVMDHTQKVRQTMSTKPGSNESRDSLACCVSSGGNFVLYDQDNMLNASNGTKPTVNKKEDMCSLGHNSGGEMEVVSNQSPVMTGAKKSDGRVAFSGKDDSVIPLGNHDRMGGVLNKGKYSSSSLVVIQADKAPSRRLLLKMVDLQEHLNGVTNKIMSGVAVSHADWERTRLLARKLGSTFANDVRFAWDQDDVDLANPSSSFAFDRKIDEEEAVPAEQTWKMESVDI